jgi:ABC-type glycerol-3-phosphate transport system substrate-binding protein
MKFDNIVLKVSSKYGGTGANAEYYRKRVEEFNALDNGITVEMDNISTESEYLDKLATSFADGNTPNVFVEFGGSRCLDNCRGRHTGRLAALPGLRQGMVGQHHGRHLGRTRYDGVEGTGAFLYLYQVCLFYNKDILAANGIEPPATFDELLADCATLKANGVYPFQVGESDIYRWGHLFNCLALKTYGTDIVTELADRTVSYDSDEMVALYQIIKDMFDNGYLGEAPEHQRLRGGLAVPVRTGCLQV